MSSAEIDIMASKLPLWPFALEGPSIQMKHIKAAAALSADQTLFHDFCSGLLFWAWQQCPWNTMFSLPLEANFPAMRKVLTPISQQQISLFNRILNTPVPDRLWAEYKQLASAERILVFLQQQTKDVDFAFFWLCAGFEELMRRGAFEELSTLLLNFKHDETAIKPFLQLMQAELALFSNSPTAFEAIKQLDDNMFAWRKWHMLAQWNIRHNNLETPVALYEKLLQAMPWHVNVLLVLHDLCFPAPKLALKDFDRDTAIMLYSWNKAVELEKTLYSLRKSNTGQAKIIALDNGSTDNTAYVLEKFQNIFAEGQFTIVKVPVNIGAPAARNWLLSLPEVRQAEFTAFLDDDILLPENWLEELMKALQNYPDSGVAGARIVDLCAPHAMQAADFHIMPTAGQDEESEERLPILNNTQSLRDSGLFRYNRPCLSVTGCCHLITKKSLEAVGGFDLRFSPTQFDDLDRDIRSFLKGLPCVYAGNLQVLHAQHSSLRQAVSKEQSAHISGNKLKLEAKYSDLAIKNLMRANKELILRDLKNKAARLAKASL